MGTSFSKLFWQGLFAFLAMGLVVLSLEAQPPGKKGRGTFGPPVNAEEILTVRGTVRGFTSAPKGETDGVTLTDGTWVHWPPHLADRFRNIVGKGDRVEAVGYMETGPEGDSKLEVSILTNLATKQSVVNPDRPAPAAQANTGLAGAGSLTLGGTVREFTNAPQGEVDGLILSDGNWVHWPPHLADRFSSIVAKGDTVRATGFRETGPKGDTKLEVSILTNTVTGKSAENPDLPTPAAERPASGNREERLRALEDQVEQILRELRGLRKEQ
jgi:hypothetical protein